MPDGDGTNEAPRTTHYKDLVLEVDHERGVMYLHAGSPEAVLEYGTPTILRICGLPTPVKLEKGQLYDINVRQGFAGVT